MKKTIVFMLTLLSIIGAANAMNVSISTNSTVSVTPATSSITLYDYHTTYHFDGSPTGRNGVAPPYEYQYAGETVHLHAVIQSGSLWAAQNALVNVSLQCPSGTIEVPLTMTSAPTSPISGQYRSTWDNDYIIPNNISENCPIFVKMTFGPSTTVDQLTNTLYTNVNDLLVNPLIVVTMGGFGFSNAMPGQETQSTPNPVTLTISSIQDREGQGTTGKISMSVNQFCGVTPAYCFPSTNLRVSTTGSPGTFTNFVSSTGTLSVANIGAVTTNPSTSFNLYFLLYLPGIAPPQVYQSVGGSLLYEIL